MKRVLLVLLLALSLAVPAHADVGSAVVILNAVAATGASAEFDLSKASAVRVQVYGTASAITLLQGRACPGMNVAVTCNSPWFTLTTVTDPTSTGEYWSIPLTMRFRANVTSYTSGTVTVVLETHAINK